MIIQSNHSFHSSNLLDAAMESLYKAEALSKIAALVDFEACSSETATNYLWALSDYIEQAKFLLNNFAKNKE